MNRIFAAQGPLFRALSGILVAGSLLNSSGLPAATPTRNIPVKMGDYRFLPDRITVQTGQTVQLELTNTDSLTPHNFTLQAAEAGLNVDVDVRAGRTEVVDITPLASGSYKFYCNKKLLFLKSHRDRGMEGTLVVGPPGPE
jgi:plastocyanin